MSRGVVNSAFCSPGDPKTCSHIYLAMAGLAALLSRLAKLCLIWRGYVDPRRAFAWDALIITIAREQCPKADTASAELGFCNGLGLHVGIMLGLVCSIVIGAGIDWSIDRLVS